MLESYDPADPAEEALLEELVNAYWRLLRLHRVETCYWDNVGGSYHPGDQGIAEALIQTPETKTRNFFRYYAQIEKSYYRALAAANQIKRERRDRKPLKALAAASENGFVSQSAEPAPVAAQPATGHWPPATETGFVSQSAADAEPAAAQPATGHWPPATNLATSHQPLATSSAGLRQTTPIPYNGNVRLPGRSTVGVSAFIPTKNVAGASPTNRADVAQLVERVLGKDEVTSSILVIGSSEIRSSSHE